MIISRLIKVNHIILPIMKRLLTIIFTLLFLYLPAVNALSVGDFTFKDEIKLNGKNLVLNGVGIRKATFFKVKVYYAPFYLEKKNSNPKDIISSAEDKKIEMLFVRDIEKKKIVDGWNEGFEKNWKDLKSISPQIKRFNSLMPSVKEGDKISFIFSNGKVTVFVKGENKGDIVGSDFQKALLSIWLGNPPNDDLKDGMLGKEI